MNRILYGAPALLLAGLLMGGCGGGGSQNGPVVSTPRAFDSLSFSLSSPKSIYAAGEPVPLAFAVTNVSDHAITVVGGGCFIRMSILEGTTVIGPEPGGCGAAGYTFTLGPGQVREFPASWDQKDIQAAQVPPATYTVVVWLTAGVVDGSNVSRPDNN
ncbi:MAG TPA: hypothetical protein VGS41_07955 [Chthonomonadales bacterium]|nr:hypothetical protein [Chthonomonadales bacterium]